MSTLHLPNLDTITQRVASELSRMVERKLVETVEARLGRVPSNEEVAAHGKRIINWPEPEWTAYFWDDVVLFAYTTKWENQQLVFRVREVKK